MPNPCGLVVTVLYYMVSVLRSIMYMLVWIQLPIVTLTLSLSFPSPVLYPVTTHTKVQVHVIILFICAETNKKLSISVLKMDAYPFSSKT